jgi:uncharacterized membrane protein
MEAGSCFGTMIRTTSLCLLAAFFVVAGVGHFVSPETYLPLMPPYLPWHLFLIYLSGAAEVAGGVGLCVPQLRRAAGWGLIALLIAVLPSNIYMLTDGLVLGGKAVPQWILWMRLPLQGVLIAWVWWAAVKRQGE